MKVDGPVTVAVVGTRASSIEDVYVYRRRTPDVRWCQGNTRDVIRHRAI